MPYRSITMKAIGGLTARLWGLVFLAVLGATVALLIAGYGVAVGVGALGGLVLGSLAGTRRDVARAGLRPFGHIRQHELVFRRRIVGRQTKRPS